MRVKVIPVPIGFQLQKPLLRERVFVKWKDASGKPLTLGSCSHDNKQNLDVFMTAKYDIDNHIHIYFSLNVFVKPGGTQHRREMLLVFSPNIDAFKDSSIPSLVSEIDDLSEANNTTLHETGISELNSVFVVKFNLLATGFTVTKKTDLEYLQPSNSTSRSLIHNLESLSKTKIFNVYIKPSGIAEALLRNLHTQLITAKLKTKVEEMYIREGAMLVQWSVFGLPVSKGLLPPKGTLPPPYTENPTPLLREVQVPRSPPVMLNDKSLSFNTIGVVIAETPTQTPVSPNLTPIIHGIFSFDVEKPFDSELNLNNFEEDSRFMKTDFDVCSDEEYLAGLNYPESSPPFKSTYDSAILKELQAKLMEWLEGAMAINENVYNHKHLAGKLSRLGYYIRTSNATGFNVTRLWCSAIFFYDPLDSIDTPETSKLYHQNDKHPVSQMFGVIRWANEFRYGAEFSSPLVGAFRKLGRAAHSSVASGMQQNEDFDSQKRVCIALTLTAFGTSGIGEKKRKAVSGKGYNFLRTPLNQVSKRAKNIK